jgi:hypothetical protein
MRSLPEDVLGQDPVAHAAIAEHPHCVGPAPGHPQVAEHAEVLDGMKDDRLACESSAGTGRERPPREVRVFSFAQALIETLEALEQAAGVEDVAGLVVGAQSVN